MEEKFSSLDFYAKHFNVPVERLSWCILRVDRISYDDYLIGIEIKDSRLVISVQECALRRRSHNYVPFAAEMRETSRGYYFTSREAITKSKKKVEIYLTRSDLRNLYRDKWYDSKFDIKAAP